MHAWHIFIVFIFQRAGFLNLEASMSLVSLVGWNVSLGSADVSWGRLRYIRTATKETNWNVHCTLLQKKMFKSNRNSIYKTTFLALCDICAIFSLIVRYFHWLYDIFIDYAIIIMFDWCDLMLIVQNHTSAQHKKAWLIKTEVYIIRNFSDWPSKQQF